MKLLDRFLSWLSEPRWRNVARADQFAREKAQEPITAQFVWPLPGTDMELLPPPGDGMVWTRAPDGTWYRLNVAGHEECTSERCTVREYHTHCLFQTALAARRDRKRK